MGLFLLDGAQNLVMADHMFNHLFAAPPPQKKHKTSVKYQDTRP